MSHLNCRAKIHQFFCWFFGKLKTQKSHSEINWPLYERVFQSVLFGIRYALLSKNDGSRARFRSLWSQSDEFSFFLEYTHSITLFVVGCNGFLSKIFQSWNQFWFLIDYLKGSNTWRSVNLTKNFWCHQISRKANQNFDRFLP